MFRVAPPRYNVDPERYKSLNLDELLPKSYVTSTEGITFPDTVRPPRETFAVLYSAFAVSMFVFVPGSIG